MSIEIIFNEVIRDNIRTLSGESISILRILNIQFLYALY